MASVVDPSTFQAVIAAGLTNTGLLGWLVRAVLRLQRKVDRQAIHMRYLRREVAYLNGVAEPEDNRDESDCTE